MSKKKQKKAIKVKEVARTEIQANKSWWAAPQNLLLIGGLLLFTLLSIYLATAWLGPADEAAEQARREAEQREAISAAGGTDSCNGGQILTGEIPEPSSELPNGKAQWVSPFPMLIDPACDYQAIIQTNKGSITVDLFEKEAPNTVNNFVVLAQSGFYNGITFHRVIPDFMAQAGDPTGTGAGGPGYSFADEFSPALQHDQPGILSMANAGANTNGSQFFITYAPTTHLDAYDAGGNLKNCQSPQTSCHAIFGVVTEGLESARALSPAGPEMGGGTADVIERITIFTR